MEYAEFNGSRPIRSLMIWTNCERLADCERLDAVDSSAIFVWQDANRLVGSASSAPRRSKWSVTCCFKMATLARLTATDKNVQEVPSYGVDEQVTYPVFRPTTGQFVAETRRTVGTRLSERGEVKGANRVARGLPRLLYGQSNFSLAEKRNIMHICKRTGASFDEVLETSRQMFQEEELKEASNYLKPD